MDEQIRKSGLGVMYNISPETDDPELAKWIGKKVRYKRNLLTEKFLASHGTMVIDAIFMIKETQLNYAGVEILRGYDSGDSFGTPIDPNHIEAI